jgi:hypothetical protein
MMKAMIEAEAKISLIRLRKRNLSNYLKLIQEIILMGRIKFLRCNPSSQLLYPNGHKIYQLNKILLLFSLKNKGPSLKVLNLLSFISIHQASL